MRKGRFTDEQMVAILGEADRGPVAGVAKKHGVSEQTIYVDRRQTLPPYVASLNHLKKKVNLERKWGHARRRP